MAWMPFKENKCIPMSKVCIIVWMCEVRYEISAFIAQQPNSNKGSLKVMRVVYMC